ncbi:MAG: HD domain-containing protein [Dysosmobacter sp.]|nr:HD domain-containing protein [Dysosmobacter sp.]
MEIPKHVQSVLTALEAAGHEAWCVGGCVRDILLGRSPEDWDVTTSALPEEVLALFGLQAEPTGLRHGTVTVKTPETAVEVTTYRIDGAYHDHRRPDSVVFTASLDQDLARRDFTVNAMAMDLQGKVRDPFKGRIDLEQNVLRCVGDPDRRFGEDALRILRGMRFSAVLGLEMDPGTSASIERNRALLRDIAPERIQAELMKLLCGPNAGWVLENHPAVLGVFWPEILPMVGFDQRNIHHCFDVWQHSLAALTQTSPVPVLRCAALLHDIGKPSAFTLDGKGVGHFYGHAKASAALTDGMLRRLKFPNNFRERTVRLVEWHDRDIPRTDKGVRRALRALGEEDLRLLLALKRADNLAQAPAYRGRQAEIQKGENILDKLLAEDACFSLKQLAVKGGDLLALGFSGPEIGRALEALLEQVVDGALPNEQAALLDHLQKMRDAASGEETM